MKTLQELKDYADTTDNVWLKHKLRMLELDIEIEIIKAEMKTQYDTIKTLKAI